ncbi:hypothetical protein HTSR_1555 [Halodesulfurarchaeum formicicum]|uniref:Uncharacterized protein n=1 Tax=Halodesulfurarchaeum formicicum TaxID=1873524 RepID=A0A1D8S5U4_9EURY|nr:hypothetical protein [Halodesulfurarchaeum formicicum]AOW80728.1 hypothetical protein HTSR_1555 [Halodesulfurarchaeum formicicum]APE96065.1 hypothetical protein HSR6_1625 [Halodesulfurarchaeum formicicum]
MEPDRNARIGSNLSRRKFVAGTAAGFATVSLAGCTDGNGEPTTTAEPEPEDYVVTDDIIVSSSYVPENAGFAQACSPSRMFVPGMHPVFKIGVYDPETGEILGNDELESVVVNIDGHGSVELAWSGDDEEHPADEWSGSWAIPEDVSPGTITYTVEVTDGDAEFQRVGILESSFTVIEYTDPRNYVITDDVYAGSAGMDGYGDNEFISSCQPSRQFAPGMMVGFDIGVYEGRTGNPVGPADGDQEDVIAGIESATITIDGFGETLDLEWAGIDDEGEPTEDLNWNATFYIPEDAESGSYTYTVELVPADDDVSSGEVGATAHVANEFTVV